MQYKFDNNFSYRIHKYSKYRIINIFLTLLLSMLASTIVCAAPIMTDISESAGIDSSISYNTSTVHGLGLNAIDFDNDGWADLFIVNGIDQVPHLYHNNGDGTFTLVDHLLPSLPNVDLNNAVYADYDADGDVDIYIVTDGNDFFLTADGNPPDGPPNILLENQWVENGNAPSSPLFIDVAASVGVDDLADPPLGELPGLRAFTGGWVDYNRDGWIDLHVGHLVFQAGGDISNRNRLWRNDSGSFTDSTVESGYDLGTDPDTFRSALASFAGHFNDDLWPDIYIVNARGDGIFNQDFLYQNDGTGAFTDIIPSMPGLGDDSGSGMGIDVADIDNDGDWDFYISDIFNTTNDATLGNSFYLGNGDGTFSDTSAFAAENEGDNSWAVNFLDVDQDGYEDLFVGTMPGASGGSNTGGDTLPDILYLNDQDGTFTNVSTEAGLTEDTNSRGAVTADIDNDGDLDIAVVRHNGPLQIFRNDSTDQGGFLKLKLRGAGPGGSGLASNVDAIGAVVEVTANGVTMMRQVAAGVSAHSQNDLVVHFGLGSDPAADTVRIRWPSGNEDVLLDVRANSFLDVNEGETSEFSSTDSDGDGIDNNADNCPAAFNAGQIDTNQNGIGDACEPQPTNDFDLDGVDNDTDICPMVANPDQDPNDDCADGTTTEIETTSVSPSEAGQGETVSITISGEGFQNGATATICQNNDVVVSNVTFVDSNTLTADVIVGAEATLMPCALNVVNPDTSSDVLFPFVIVEGDTTPPADVSINSVNPGSLAAGESGQITITGEGFQDGASLTVCLNQGVTIDQTTFVDSTTILADITISSDIALDVCTLAIDNPDGNFATFFPFVIDDPVDPPADVTIDSIDPAEVTAGTSAQITLTGSGFQDQATVTVCQTQGVTVTQVSVVDATTIVADIAVDADITAETCAVAVDNPDGGVAAFSPLVILPDDGGEPLPLALNSVTPNEISQGESIQITFSGQGFVDGATVRICRDGRVSLGTVTFVNSSTLLVDVSADSDARTGNCGVSVTNPDGDSDSIRGGFSVIEGDAPPAGDELTVTSVDPSTLTIGSTADVTITGTGFDPGMDVFGCRRHGLIFNSVTVDSAESATVNITVPSGGAGGTCSLIVNNEDGERLRVSNALTLQ